MLEFWLAITAAPELVSIATGRNNVLNCNARLFFTDRNSKENL